MEILQCSLFNISGGLITTAHISFGAVDPCSQLETDSIANTPNGWSSAVQMRIHKGVWGSSSGAHNINNIDVAKFELKNIADEIVFEVIIDSNQILSIISGQEIIIDLPGNLEIHSINMIFGVNDCCSNWGIFDDWYRISIEGIDKSGEQYYLTEDIEIPSAGEYVLFNNNVFPTLYSVDRVTIRNLSNDKISKNGVVSLKSNVLHIDNDIVGYFTSLGGSLFENPLIWQFQGQQCQRFLNPIGGSGYELPNSIQHYYLNFYLDVQGFNESGIVCCDDLDEDEIKAERPFPPKPEIDCDCDALYSYIQFLQEAILILNNRLEIQELKMSEISDGMDCICNAIQNLQLSFEPTINNEIDNTGIEGKLENIKQSIDNLELECNTTVEPSESSVIVQPSPVPVTVQPSPVPVTVEPSPVPVNVQPSSATVQNQIDFSTVNNNLVQIKTAIENIQMNISTGDVTLNQDFQQLIDALNDLLKCDTENLACVLRNRLEIEKGEETKTLTQIVDEKVIPHSVNEIHTLGAESEVFETRLSDYEI